MGNDTPASPFHAGLSLPCWHQHSRTGDRDLLGVLPKCSSQSTALRVPTGTLEKNIWQQREERGVGGRTGWLSWAQGSFLVPISSPEMDPLAPSRDSCPCSAASAHLAAPSLLYPALGTILSLVVDFIQTGLHFPFFFFSYKLISIQTCIKNPPGVLHARYVQSVSYSFSCAKAKYHR